MKKNNQIKFTVTLPDGADRYEFEERAALYEYYSGMSRSQAEKAAFHELYGKVEAKQEKLIEVEKKSDMYYLEH